MRVLVTGGAGFIGSHVAQEYADRGAQVLVVDNLNDYYSPQLKMLRKENFLSHPKIDFKKLDLIQNKETNELVSMFEPDTIIHLAAQAGVRLPIERYIKYTDSNLTAFSNILQGAVINSVPNFIYASSSSVYGNSEEMPYSETQSNLAPISYYGATKLSNEIVANAMTRNTATRALGLRFFTVYGPWGRPDMAYFRLVKALMLQEEFKLFGNGTLRRDFTYIKDAVECLTRLVDKLNSGAVFESSVVNVGGGNNRSMSDLIEIVNSLDGTSLNVSYLESFDGDVRETLADSSILQRISGYIPDTQLEVGVPEVHKWMVEPDIRKFLKNWQ